MKLHDYVHNYLLIAGKDVANWMAASVHRSNADAVRGNRLVVPVRGGSQGLPNGDWR